MDELHPNYIQAILLPVGGDALKEEEEEEDK
jgi:hypothetical protein